jgi:hypothetical protein
MAHGSIPRPQLNVQNYVLGSASKRTLEVRVWAGTLSDTEVVAAICMAVALVVKAANELTTDANVIDSADEAIKTFCKSHFRQADCLIVPDGPIGDIVWKAYHRVKEARQYLG